MTLDMQTIAGLHHVTAIVADAQRTLDFYTHLLGLRLVKRTVNFDDPGSYHLYFGDYAGTPGTILTFFAWPGTAQGTRGDGETHSIAFSVPQGSLDFWVAQLTASRIQFERPAPRCAYGKAAADMLRFTDPDGIQIELIAHDDAETFHPLTGATIPGKHAIRGFFGVTLGLVSAALTEKVLAAMGFVRIAEQGSRICLAAPGNGLGSRLDIVAATSARGRMGAGTIHHIAFRNADDTSQLAWRAHLGAQGLPVTPVMDRTYFHSVYFREPGGVLFELATDPPGFTLDEPVETLGEALQLPEWLELQRVVIEQRLPPLASVRTAELTQ